MNGKDLFLLVGVMIIFVFSSGCSFVVSTQQTVTSEAYVERRMTTKGFF